MAEHGQELESSSRTMHTMHTMHTSTRTGPRTDRVRQTILDAHAQCVWGVVGEGVRSGRGW